VIGFYLLTHSQQEGSFLLLWLMHYPAAEQENNFCAMLDMKIYS
jgi:hypothetical protein